MTTTRAGQTRTSVFDSRNWQIRIDWSDSTPDIMRATNSMSLFIPPESLVYYPTHIQHMLQVVTKEQQQELDKEARFRWELMEATKKWSQEPPPHSLPAVIPNPSSPGESSLPASTPPFLRLSLEKQEELHQAFKAHWPSPPPSGR